MSAAVFRKLQQAHEHLHNGDADRAAALCEEVLRRAPHNPDALWLLGTARLMTGGAEAAIPLFERALNAAPKHGASLENLGLAHLMRGDYGNAERALRKAGAIVGAPPSVFMRLGIALLHQSRFDEAVQELERTLVSDPQSVDAYLNLGLAHARLGDPAAAERQFEAVLRIDREHSDATYNLGVLALEHGQHERARAAFERVLRKTPAHAEARERLVAMDLSVGRFRAAMAHLRQLLQIRPGYVPALLALANACFETGALDEAHALAIQARELDPSLAGTYGILARVHYVQGEYDRAAALLEEGHARSGSSALLGTLVHLRHRMCDWPKWQAAWQRLEPELAQSVDCGSPFYLLCEPTSPVQQLEYSRRWSGARFSPATATPPDRDASTPQRRLRVGYFSPDFHEHATAYLLAQVLERHDRERFEIYAYSYGPEDHSPMRARVRSAVEHFIDVAWDPDDVVLERLRADALDVLVDLKGHLMGERLRVLAQRPCTAQVTWLGYPGTTGAGFIDYLIADPFVIPPGAESAYSERIVRLPHCYQPNDRERPRTDALPRAAYGLPEDAFVFCCFNQTVKITPDVWARWVNLLRRVPGSVLWVLEDNAWASENLRASLPQADIDPARLVFAPRAPMPEHLARYGAADLALDTFPYTSHTTASDALWMGCPLVALCGNTFASRVSGSLLSSCGMSDFITYSLEEYEALVYRLASDASCMRDVRARLAAARDHAPLFDSEKFTRELETLYLQIAG